MKRNILYSLPFALVIAILAACGVNTTTGGAATTPTARAAVNCPPFATGTIKSISSTGLLLSTTQGTIAQVILGSSTVFIRQGTGTRADLKEGARVSAIIQLNNDGTYSALNISVRSTTANLPGLNGLTGGTRVCIGPRGGGASGTPRAKGTPGAGFGGGFSGTPGTGFSGGSNGQTLNGIVGQLNGNSLVITDTSGNNITIQLTSTTRIATTETIAASDLKVGESVTATGTKDSQGAIHATYVLILARQAPVTPTPNG